MRNCSTQCLGQPVKSASETARDYLAKGRAMGRSGPGRRRSARKGWTVTRVGSREAGNGMGTGPGIGDVRTEGRPGDRDPHLGLYGLGDDAELGVALRRCALVSEAPPSLDGGRRSVEHQGIRERQPDASANEREEQQAGLGTKSRGSPHDGQSIDFHPNPKVSGVGPPGAGLMGSPGTRLGLGRRKLSHRSRPLRVRPVEGDGAVRRPATAAPRRHRPPRGPWGGRTGTTCRFRPPRRVPPRTRRSPSGDSVAW